MNRLAEETAIVTDGAVGTGRARVLGMAEEGAKVAIFDVLDAQRQSLVSELTAIGPVRRASSDCGHYKTQLCTDCDLTFVLTNGGHKTGTLSEPGLNGRPYRLSQHRAGALYLGSDSLLVRSALQAG